ncbi:MAG: hypothetical protein JWR63_547 [Conexibacter sp.]|nr:hypothetical protein [Conexibacter sp.]
MTAPKGPAASGARLLGDDYQHLLTWLYAAQLLREDPDVVRVELEKHGAGNVDDIVVHRKAGVGDYHQVKFTTKPGQPLTARWFTDPSEAKRSPLQRFYHSWLTLGKDDAKPSMVLHTNRLPAADDRLLACLDGMTLKLVPKLRVAGKRSGAGKVRAAWATHLEISEDELLDLLEDFQIRAGRASLGELREHCSWVMEAVGLLATADAIDAGMLAVRRWVQENVREVMADAVDRLVDEHSLRAPRRRATVLIQAIARDPMPELADVALDWTGAFEDDRRTPVDPDVWQTRLAAELRTAEQHIAAAGISDVRLAGAYRLTPALYAATVFCDMKQYKLAIPGRSGDKSWIGDITTDGALSETAIEVIERPIEAGEELAVGISVSADVTDDVLAHIAESGLPISEFVNIRVPNIGRDALADPAAMRGWAAAVTDELRGLAHRRAGRVHLFLAVPRPAAVLLGHQWNRMPVTQLWEESGEPGRYLPSFSVGG